jgi:hypothetical protein
MSEPPKQSGLFLLTVKSDPLPMDADIFNLVGQIVVHWSRIESQIDQDIYGLRQYPIVRALAEEIPHTFKKKLELWRRSIRTLYPKIKLYQDEADAFRDGVKKIAQYRNHIIHGTWTLSANSEGDFMVSNYREVRGQGRHDELWVGRKLLEALVRDVETLSDVIMSFNVSRMLHGHHGLLQADREPSPDHQAHSTPANPETPPAPPESSQE